MADTATKVTRVTRLDGLHFRADPPDWVLRRWQTDAENEAAMEAWAGEFNRWVRDHRSQDSVTLEVVRETSERCSACGDTWEPVPGSELGDDYEARTLYCAACGREVGVADGTP